jgi:hypothetical protein
MIDEMNTLNINLSNQYHIQSSIESIINFTIKKINNININIFVNKYNDNKLFIIYGPELIKMIKYLKKYLALISLRILNLKICVCDDLCADIIDYLDYDNLCSDDMDRPDIKKQRPIGSRLYKSETNDNDTRTNVNFYKIIDPYKIQTLIKIIYSNSTIINIFLYCKNNDRYVDHYTISNKYLLYKSNTIKLILSNLQVDTINIVYNTDAAIELYYFLGIDDTILKKIIFYNVSFVDEPDTHNIGSYNIQNNSNNNAINKMISDGFFSFTIFAIFDQIYDLSNYITNIDICSDKLTLFITRIKNRESVCLIKNNMRLQLKKITNTNNQLVYITGVSKLLTSAFPSQCMCVQTDLLQCLTDKKSPDIIINKELKNTTKDLCNILLQMNKINNLVIMLPRFRNICHDNIIIQNIFENKRIVSNLVILLNSQQSNQIFDSILKKYLNLDLNFFVLLKNSYFRTNSIDYLRHLTHCKINNVDLGCIYLDVNFNDHQHFTNNNMSNINNEENINKVCRYINNKTINIKINMHGKLYNISIAK